MPFLHSKPHKHCLLREIHKEPASTSLKLPLPRARSRLCPCALRSLGTALRLCYILCCVAGVFRRKARARKSLARLIQPPWTYPFGRVAQLAEHSALNRQVVGSIPTASTIHPQYFLFFNSSAALESSLRASQFLRHQAPVHEAALRSHSVLRGNDLHGAPGEIRT